MFWRVFWLHIAFSCFCVIDSALPCDSLSDAVVDDAANEKVDKERDAENRDCCVGSREVGTGNSRVETPERPDPDDEKCAALPGDKPEDSKREPGQTEEEKNVQDTPEGEGNWFGEEKGEVLGPAFDHRGGGAVHAGGERFGCVTEADGATAAFDVLGEGDVFEDVATDDAVAAYGEVGVALDEEELSVGGSETACRIVDLVGWVDRHEFGEDKRHDSLLPEAFDDLTWRVGEEGSVVFVQFAKRAGEVVGFVDGVGVGEEEVLSASFLCGGPARIALAGEPSASGEVEGWGIEKNDSIVAGRGLLSDLAGIVGRVVVDDDQLPLLAEEKSELRLADQGRQTVGQGAFLVAGGDNDGEFQVGLFG
jgi:hypothetical protein